MDYQFILNKYPFPVCLHCIYVQQNTFINCLAACPDEFRNIGKNDF